MLFFLFHNFFCTSIESQKNRDFVIASYLLRGVVIRGGYYRKWQESSKFLCGGELFKKGDIHHIGDLFVKAGVQINFQRGQFRLNGGLL